MSDIPFTVLISSAGNGPFQDRALKPVGVASLWVGGSAAWKFTSLVDGTGGTVTLRADNDEADTLAVGTAAYLLHDQETHDQLAKHDAIAPLAPSLIARAHDVLAGQVRLTVVAEADATQLIQQLLTCGIDADVAIPSTVAAASLRLT